MVASTRDLTSAKGALAYYESENGNAGRESYQDSAWAGSGANDIGLSGSVTRDDFSDLLEGKMPNSQQLGKLKNGELQHRSGTDITFSAPKSASILELVAGDKRVKEAWDASIEKTIAMLEKDFSFTRMGKDGGVEYTNTGNLIIAKFDHNSSREHDPQRHSHIVIMNATMSPDGKYRSLDLRPFHDGKMYIGMFQRNEFAYELKQRGFAIELREKGLFEIKGVPQALMSEMSKRRQQIVSELQTYDYVNAKTAQNVTLMTRQSKEDKPFHELDDMWQKAAQKYGFDRESYNASDFTKSPRVNISDNQRAHIKQDALKYAVEHLSERETMLSVRNLEEHILHKAFGDLHSSEVSNIIDEALAQGYLLPTQISSQKEELEKFVISYQTLKYEKENIDYMLAAKDSGQAIASKEEWSQYLQDNKHNFVLRDGQKEAAEMMLTTRDKVIGIQGYAGVGKTFAFGKVREFGLARGIKFMGIAPSNTAASILESDSGISSSTMHKFIADHEKFINGDATHAQIAKQRAEMKNLVVVLDESSLAGNQVMNDLLKIRDRLGFSLVMAGDVSQHGAVEAGKPFEQLQDAGMNTAIIGEIVRQKDNPELLSAVHDSLKGDIESSFGKLTKVIDAEIALGKSDPIKADEMSRLAVGNWFNMNEYERKNSLILSPDNKTRQLINTNIRNQLQQQGNIDNSEITVKRYEDNGLTKSQKRYAANYKIGDVVMFYKSHKPLGLERGKYYQVTNVKDAKDVHLKSNEGREVIWRPSKFNNKFIGSVRSFTEKNLAIAKGDVLRWTSNDRALGIKNSHSAYVKDIKGNNIALHLKEEGKNITLEKDASILKHVDYGYAFTSYAAQGKNVSKVIAVAHSKNRFLTNQRTFYVVITRAKNDATMIVDNEQKVIDRISKNSGADISAMETQNIHYKGEKKTIRNMLKTMGQKILRNIGFTNNKDNASFSSVNDAVHNALWYLEQKSTRFSEQDIIKHARNYCLDDIKDSEIKGVIAKLVQEKILLKADKEKNLYSSYKILESEKHLLDTAQKAQKFGKAIASRDEVSHILGNSDIGKREKLAIERIFSSPDRIGVFNNFNADSKSKSIHNMEMIAHEKDRSMLVLANSDREAARIKRDEGFQAESYHRFFSRLEGSLASNKDLKDVYNKYSSKVLFLDNAHNILVNEMANLLEHVNRFDLKLVLSGNTRENDQTPNAYAQLINSGLLKLDHNIKGKDILKDNVPVSAEQQKMVNALSALSSVTQSYDIASAAARKWQMESEKIRENTVVFAASQQIQSALNQQIRNILKNEGKIHGKAKSLDILQNKYFSETQKSFASNYKIGDIVGFDKNYKSLAIEKGEYYQVSAVDKELNYVYLQTQDGKQAIWRPAEQNTKNAITIYEQKSIDLQVGDKVKWGKYDNAQVTKIAAAHIKLNQGKGKELKVKMSDPNIKHLAYHYASLLETDKIRARDNLIIAANADSSLLAKEGMLYDSLAKSKGSNILFTDNVTKLTQKFSDLVGDKVVAHDVHGVRFAAKNIYKNSPSATIKTAGKFRKHKINAALHKTIKYLTRENSVFTMRDIYSKVAELALGEFSHREINHAITSQVQKGEILPSNSPGYRTMGLFTNKETLALGEKTIDIVANNNAKLKPIYDKNSALQIANKEASLYPGQKEVLRKILTSKHRVTALQALAGRGKMKSLAAVNHYASNKGWQLMVLTQNESAKKMFDRNTAITTKTLDEFLSKHNNLLGSNPSKSTLSAMRKELAKTMIVLDKSSATSTKNMHDLQSIMQKLDLRLLMSDDKNSYSRAESAKPFAQLLSSGVQSIDADKILKQIAQTPEKMTQVAKEQITSEMRENTKQHIVDKITSFIKGPSLNKKSNIPLKSNVKDQFKDRADLEI